MILKDGEQDDKCIFGFCRKDKGKVKQVNPDQKNVKPPYFCLKERDSCNKILESQDRFFHLTLPPLAY